MNIVTDYRGVVEYSEEDIITFADGLFGFEQYQRFILIANEERELPFHWLQSVEEESLTFVITDPFLFVEHYDFEIDEHVEERLALENVDDILIYSTVVIPEFVEEITISLRSPIVINTKNRMAKQVILDEDYPYKHYIFKKGDA